MSVQPLSYSDVAECIRLEYWEEDSDFFLRCVSALDDKYLEIAAEKAKAKRESDAELNKQRRPRKR